MIRRWWDRRAVRAQRALPEALRSRALAWQDMRPARLDRSFSESRWVVVDVESSGLDINRDSLIAIGALAVQGDAIDHADSFEVVLRQDHISSDDNILIHGIAGTEQRQGREPAEALLEFLEFVGGDPLIAFHAFFDEAMLGRACRSFLGLHLDRRWLDLAHLAPALIQPDPRGPRRGQGLDDWLARFGLQVSERHRAVADAYATAQLWLALGPSLDGVGVRQSREVLNLAEDFDRARRNGLNP